uniref:Uncharacterized protein n=1 Tax=Glossina morsitans morsitans TaxID=37546 RepID=A0A1B0G8B1_GLOMM
MFGFDATDGANAELLNKLKDLDVRVDSAKANKCLYLKNCWRSLKLRATLNHIGLLVGLSVYCGVGGVKCVDRVHQGYGHSATIKASLKSMSKLIAKRNMLYRLSFCNTIIRMLQSVRK